MSFRKNLEYLRKERKLSQEDLAYKLGVSRQAVSKWESGAAYPETEKIITVCKLFDCSLDELIKEDIAELRKEEVKRYTFNDLLKEVTDLVKRTSDMLNSMSGKFLFKFIFELGVLLLLILLLRIPFLHLRSLGYSIFFVIGGQTGDILIALWRFLIEIIYFVIAAISFLYIYKIRFLDRSDVIKEKYIEESSKVKKDTKEREVVKYDFGVFSLLGRAFVLFIKLFVTISSVPVIFTIFFAIAGLVVVFSWIFEGVFFFSLIVFALSFLLFATLFLYVVYNFIVNRRSKWDRVFLLLLISFLGFGISMGVGVLEMKNFTLTGSPHEYVVRDRKEETIDMTGSLIVGDTWDMSTKYIEDESLSDKVRIEVFYYNDFREIEIQESAERVFIISKQENVPLSKAYRMLIRDLKEKTVHVNYDYLFRYEIVVYTSKENIEKIQSNVESARSTYEEIHY